MKGSAYNMEQLTITLAIASIMVLGYFISCSIATQKLNSFS